MKIELSRSLISLCILFSTNLNGQNALDKKQNTIAVEAESFYKQSKSEIRKWYTVSVESDLQVTEVNENVLNSASNLSYIELLPDTRTTHSDKLIHGENFSNEAGEMAILHYKVEITTPGRYYVWARAYSTGSEDNGVHVGYNGIWPKHGERMQWCDGKNEWTWASRQRTKEVHCGIPKEIYLDIDEPGVHDIQFSMREDGFKFDKFILTTNINYIPIDKGPEMLVFTPSESYFKQISTSLIDNKSLPVDDFPVSGTNFYRDAGRNWLAIKPDEYKEAETTTSFNFKSGNYDIILTAVGENDGQSEFRILINDEPLDTFTPTLSNDTFEEGPKYNILYKNKQLNNGDKITVKSKIGSTDGNEWARGRWSGIIFTPIGYGEKVLTTPFITSAIAIEQKSVAIKPPKGRIAVVADGNSPDPDDLGGTAVSLALLSASGLQGKLVHYSHSCDLVRVERISVTAEKERHALMQSACDVTARRWGGFDNLTFFDAKWQQKETIIDLSKAINASSAEDPLWIIEAGEPDIIGYALKASIKEKRQYVKVITHHPANDDAGDFFTWQQILDFGIEEVRIPDQNVYLKVDEKKWDWAKNHKDPRLQWIWIQGKIAEIDDVVTFQKGKWDCSDAGMVLYWLTGANEGGLLQGTVDDVKTILMDYINSPK